MDDRERDEVIMRLWDEHHAAVLAYARRRTGEQGAQEAVSEAFVRAWHRPDAAVEVDPRTWLLSAARSAIANGRRGERRRRALVERLRRERAEAAPDPALLVGEDRAVRDAFAALTPRDREVLALVAWEGLDPEAAGRVLGCSATTFSGRLFRARRRLERALAEAGDPAAARATVAGDAP
ncbi:MAG: RNA polymerase sigma factor [Thermoleophilia bacterium]